MIYNHRAAKGLLCFCLDMYMYIYIYICEQFIYIYIYTYGVRFGPPHIYRDFFFLSNKADVITCLGFLIINDIFSHNTNGTPRDCSVHIYMCMRGVFNTNSWLDSSSNPCSVVSVCERVFYLSWRSNSLCLQFRVG